MTEPQETTPTTPSPLKRALVAIERLEQRLEAERAARTEPIAIVGAGCRLPAGIDDLAAYWAFLRAGCEARREVPRDRWDADAYYDADPSVPGTMVSRYGGFRERIDGFDAGFFGISPREAEEIDPQHRMLLEVAWEALEDAGQPPTELAGTRTGVFVGVMNADYGKLEAHAGDYRAVSAYTTTGSQQSFAAGRIAYVLGLQGPCLAVDTACSSSLVAVHLACRSLRAGDCDVALAGGVSLMVTPELGVFLTKARVLAPDGRCKAFDASADGIGRGEGAAIVTLKRLRDAVAAGDRILAVVRGTATNHDGRSGGLTVPSRAAQEALVRAALADARIEPAQVAYVEAHGTGTPLGDLVEARALAAVFGPGRREPLQLGSVKTNLGHLDAAAGIAGLLKVVAMLRHGEIPPHLHLCAPNPEIPWRDGHLAVPTTLTPWPGSSTRAPRIAGVSSFGLSGVNAHVVLEEPPAAPVPGEREASGPQLLVLSARSDAAAQALAQAYAERLRRATGSGLEDVVIAACRERDHHERRIAVLGHDGETIASRLDALALGGSPPCAWRGTKPTGASPRVAFVFSGMGVSALGVGRGLWAQSPVFRAALEQVDAAVRRHSSVSLVELVRAGAGTQPSLPIDALQPLLFGVGVALSATWRAWGVEPDAVVGHSMGEVTAAYVCGALDLDDAARVICARSRLLRRASGRGAMAAVELPAALVVERLATEASAVAVAAINGPRASVLSGEPAALERVLGRLGAEGVEHRRLDVDVAFHGPHMDELLAPLRAELVGLSPREGACVLWSTVTGKACEGRSLGADHWARNLRETVRLAPAIAGMTADGDWLLVEVGPHPILRPHLQAAAPSARMVASLRRGMDEHEAMLSGLAEAYVGGASIRWRDVHPRRRAGTGLPTYPWQRERHWLAPRRDVQPRVVGSSGRASEHPLLGVELETALSPRLRCHERRLGVSELGELCEHRVQGQLLLAGTAIADLALAAGRSALGTAVVVRDLVFRAPVRFDDDPARTTTLQTIVERGAGDGRVSFQLASRSETGGWRVHATAELEPADAEATLGARDERAAELREQLAAEPGAGLYDALARRGLEYGPAFRGITTLWRGVDEALAELETGRDGTGYHVHPAVLDAAFHALLAALPSTDEPWVPVRIERLRVHTRPTSVHAPLRSHARARRDEEGGWGGDVRLLAADGEVLVEAEGLWLRPLASAEDRGLAARIFAPVWSATPRLASGRATPGSDDRWLLVARAGATSDRIHAAAQQRGVAVTRVEPGATLPELAGLTDVIVVCGEPGDVAHATAAALEAAQADGVEVVLEVIKAALEREARPRLWLVTHRTQAVRRDEPVVPTHAPVWGLGRTLGYEHPQLRCTLVDLGEADDVDALVDEVLARTDETEVALRPHGRHVGRLVRDALAASKAVPVRTDATYLVTGGLGGLGLSVATWLAEQGASHLVLTSRHGVTTPSQQQALEALRTRGCEVRDMAVDAGDTAAVTELMAAIARTMPPLRGIVHAAGVLDDGMLARGDAGWLRRVMAPKLRGAFELHRLTRGVALDFFVLYGSISGLLGAPGQGNYAAGNAFLQALAHHRRAAGLPATCIDWGAFSEVGMAAGAANRGERLAARGMGSMSPREGTQALARVLGADAAELGIAELDVYAWIEAHPHLRGSPRLAALVEAQGSAAAVRGGPTAAVTLRAELRAHPAERHRGVVEAHVRGEVARVLRLDPARLEAASPLASQGVDSLMAIELRNRFEASAGVRLPVTTLLQGSGIDRIAAALLEHLTSESLLESVRDAAVADVGDEWEVITL